MRGHRIAGILWIIALSACCSPGLVLSQRASAPPQLQVVYPREGLTLLTADSAFVFGNVQPKDAVVFVDGVKTRQYANGTFLVVVPISPGEYTFRCQAVANGDTTSVLRTVTIPQYLTTGPEDSLGIDTSYVFPNRPLALQAGDRITVLFKGTPDCSASFSIANVATDLPMTEKAPRRPFDWGDAVFGQEKPPAIPKVQGIYTGSYVIRESDPSGIAPIQFRLTSKKGKTATLFASGEFQILRNTIPRVAELTREITVGRTGPGKGYYYFLPSGVRLWITGRDGEFYRARLSEVENAWIPANALQFLPPGTLPPESDIAVVRTQSLPQSARIKVFLQERLPFRVSQKAKPHQLILTIFGGTANTDWIRYDFGDPLIGAIRWQQTFDKVYDLVIPLNVKQQWGYRVFYENNTLILEIRRPPKISGWPGSPLRGLLIAVDPGHGPDLGAIGPTGVPEKNVTIKYAYELRDQLLKKGARVLLTRESTYGINLASRSKIADAANANLFISLHFNALPDGVNPFISRGTSSYYYHVQSYPLAVSIQKELLQKIGLPDFGLYYDNLSVCRLTSMPSVLIEPAFIMHPIEEMRIHDPKFRRETCQAIVAGLEAFLKKAKE